MTIATSVLTTYGLTALASAPQGNYVAPLYLVLENYGSALTGTLGVGATAITITGGVIHLVGDTQIVVGIGTPAQEVVAFSSTTTLGGSTTYYLTTPTVHGHVAGEHVCRLPLTSDTMSQVVGEFEYDHANDPNTRVQSLSGYSTGNGVWTMQFYITGIEASSYITLVGISDSPTIGQGNLHGHMVLGVDHTYNALAGGVDIEIDIPITLT